MLERSGNIRNKLRLPSSKEAGVMLLSAAALNGLVAGPAEAKNRTTKVDNATERYTLTTSETTKKQGDKLTISEKAVIDHYDDKGDAEELESNAYSTRRISIKLNGNSVRSALNNPKAVRAINKAKSAARQNALNEARRQDSLEKVIVNSETIEEGSTLDIAIDNQVAAQQGELVNNDFNTWKQGTFTFQDGDTTLNIAYVKDYKLNNGSADNTTTWETLEKDENQDEVMSRLLTRAETDLQEIIKK